MIQTGDMLFYRSYKDKPVSIGIVMGPSKSNDIDVAWNDSKPTSEKYDTIVWFEGYWWIEASALKGRFN